MASMDEIIAGMRSNTPGGYNPLAAGSQAMAPSPTAGGPSLSQLYQSNGQYTPEQITQIQNEMMRTGNYYTNYGSSGDRGGVGRANPIGAAPTDQDMAMRQQLIQQRPDLFQHHEDWLQKHDTQIAGAGMAALSLGAMSGAMGAAGGSGAGGGAGGGGAAVAEGGGGLAAGASPAGTIGLAGSTPAAYAAANATPYAAGAASGAAPLGAAGGGFSSFGNLISGSAGAGTAGTAAGLISPTTVGLAGLGYNIYNSEQQKRIAENASNKAQALNQPQRFPAQNLMNQYLTGGQDITKQPAVASDLAYMSRQATAKLAQQQMTGSGNAPITAINYANESLQRTQQPYLNFLAGVGGYNQGTGNAGDLYGQYENASNNSIGYGLSNLFAGMNAAPGTKTNQGATLGPTAQPQLNNSSSISGSNKELNV